MFVIYQLAFPSLQAESLPDLQVSVQATCLQAWQKYQQGSLKNPGSRLAALSKPGPCVNMGPREPCLTVIGSRGWLTLQVFTGVPKLHGTHGI